MRALTLALAALRFRVVATWGTKTAAPAPPGEMSKRRPRVPGDGSTRAKGPSDACFGDGAGVTGSVRGSRRSSSIRAFRARIRDSAEQGTDFMLPAAPDDRLSGDRVLRIPGRSAGAGLPRNRHTTWPVLTAPLFYRYSPLAGPAVQGLILGLSRAKRAYRFKSAWCTPVTRRRRSAPMSWAYRGTERIFTQR